MEYIHTALLLQKVGKEVNENNVKKVLEAAGAHAEEAKIKALVSALDGVDVEKIIKEASIMPVAAIQAALQEAKKEEKKEDKKSEETAAAGLGSLFG